MHEDQIKAPSNQVGSVPPPAGQPRERDGSPPTGPVPGDATPSPAPAARSEFVLLLRWITGLVIVMVAGWAFIAVVAYAGHAHKLPLSMETAVLVASLFSFGFFFLLERNLWL